MFNYQKFACYVKNKKNPTIPQQVTGGKTPNAKSRTMSELFQKTVQNKKTEFPDLKRDFEIYTKSRIINLKSDP